MLCSYVLKAELDGTTLSESRLQYGEHLTLLTSVFKMSRGPQCSPLYFYCYSLTKLLGQNSINNSCIIVNGKRD